MGVFTWYDDPLANPSIPGYREYAQVILNAPLEAGRKYSVSFYVRPYYGRGQYASDRIGAYFSTGPVGNTQALVNVAGQRENVVDQRVGPIGVHLLRPVGAGKAALVRHD